MSTPSAARSADRQAPGQPWRWQGWAPDLVAAGLLALVGALEVLARGPSLAAGLLVLGTAGAVALARHAGAVSLGVVWCVLVVQLGEDLPLVLVQLALTYVAFALARWGSIATVVLSGISIPLAALVTGLALVFFGRGHPLLSVFDVFPGTVYGRLSDVYPVAAGLIALLGLSLLGLPWLAGVAARSMSRAATSERFQDVAEADAARAVHEAQQAQEIARLREDQAGLARDVHDVVGHSLAVILAQAESAQFLGDDPAVLRDTMATIATSARRSLQDVRQVLTASAGSSEGPGRSGPGTLSQLVDGLRAGGHEVRSQVVGTPRPLPPELETVAYRVLQEMLTNAIKHGVRDRPVLVERHWEGDLRIEVRNTVAPTDLVGDETMPLHLDGSDGQGVEGMRRRLESVGGHLDVRRREESGETTFTATAWVPVRTVGG